MTFRYDTSDGERRCVIGRLQGRSPAKYGPLDWVWSYPAFDKDGNEKPILPTVAEAVALGPLLAITQEDRFHPDPSDVRNIRSWLLEAAEWQTVRETMAQAHRLQLMLDQAKERDGRPQ